MSYSTYTLRAECPICLEDVVIHVTSHSGSYWTQPSADLAEGAHCEHYVEDEGRHDGQIAVFTDGSRVPYREAADDDPNCDERDDD